jgi:hypothetical protein
LSPTTANASAYLQHSLRQILERSTNGSSRIRIPLWCEAYGHPLEEALKLNVLPSLLKHLETNVLFEKYGIGKDILPHTLGTLKLCFEKSGYFRFSSPSSLPLSLKEVHLGNEFNRPFERVVLPQSL